MFRRLAMAAPLFLFAPPALAQDAPDVVKSPDAAASKDVTRPWLYNDDPTIPSPLHVVASLGDTYSGNDRSVSRAFSSHDDGPGGKANATVQVGVAHMLAIDVTGVLGGFGNGVGGGVMAGARFAPFDMQKHGFRLAVAAGYLLDLDQASGFYGRLTASWDVGRVRFAAMFHGEHVARVAGDPVDLYATFGTSVRLAQTFRLGVEYVAQDLEEAFVANADAEGGVHQFVGLTGTIELLRRKLFLDFGPALAFRPEIGQVAPVGRALVSYTF
jgi:hypothetical protein